MLYGSEEDPDQFQPSPAALLDARALKLMIKSSGHKVSGNGFEALNLFLRQLLVALAMGTGRAVRRKSFLHDSTDQSDDQAENVPWTAVIEAVKLMVPALEGWFNTWYEQLVKHVDHAHAGHLPGEIPCCREIADATILLNPEECCSQFRAVLARGNLAINWYGMAAVCCAAHEVIQWVVRVGLRLLDGAAAGLGTLRRADVVGIVERAPIFEQAHSHLAAVLPYIASTMPATMTGPSAANITSIMPTYMTGPALTAKFETPKELSVEELCKLVETQLHPSSPAASKPFGVPIPSPLTIHHNHQADNQQHQADNQPKQQETGTRFIACIDHSFPWLQVRQPGYEQERAIFVRSTGVQTDDPAEGEEGQVQRLKDEVAKLKGLLMNFIK